MFAKAILLVLLSCLAACSTPSATSVKPVNPSIPYSLKADCRSPEDIPDGDLTYDDAVVKWSKDRASLEECRIRHKGLADAVSALEG